MGVSVIFCFNQFISCSLCLRAAFRWADVLFGISGFLFQLIVFSVDFYFAVCFCLIILFLIIMSSAQFKVLDSKFPRAGGGKYLNL